MKTDLIDIAEEYEIKINLKKILDDKNVNRFTLSNLTKTKMDTVNRFYYNNVSKIDLEILKKFCLVLDCKISDLLVLQKK